MEAIPDSDAESSPPVSPDELRGWIVPLIRKLLLALTAPSDQLLGSRINYLRIGRPPQDTKARARRVDWLVATVVVGEAVCYCVIVLCPWFCQGIAAFLLGWRIIDIVATTCRVSLFDRLERGGGHRLVVASHVRIVVLGIVNYIELLVCFGGIHAFNAPFLRPEVVLPDDWFAPLYFSAVTQFTIGYGDILPIGISRVVVVCQAMSSLLLLALIVGRFVSLLKPEQALDDSDAPKP